MIIGSHVGFTKDKQLLGSLNESLEYGANTFMFYTGAPQNTLRYPIDEELTNKAINKMQSFDIDSKKVIVHAPYIINLANDDHQKHDFAIHFLDEELERCYKLHMKYLVLHPGSHVGVGVEKGIANIVDGINKVLGKNDVTILIETMAGKGSEIGKNFEEIGMIINGVNDKNHIGVCMDTCHLNDYGYDITNFNKVLDEFEKIVGLKYLKCIHINDSKNTKESHKDRHENIGHGTIGFSNIIDIIYNNRLSDIPKILETPYINGKPPYKEEIEMIRKKVFKDIK